MENGIAACINRTWRGPGRYSLPIKNSQPVNVVMIIIIIMMMMMKLIKLMKMINDDNDDNDDDDDYLLPIATILATAVVRLHGYTRSVLLSLPLLCKMAAYMTPIGIYTITDSIFSAAG